MPEELGDQHPTVNTAALSGDTGVLLGALQMENVEILTESTPAKADWQ